MPASMDIKTASSHSFLHEVGRCSCTLCSISSSLDDNANQGASQCWDSSHLQAQALQLGELLGGAGALAGGAARRPRQLPPRPVELRLRLPLRDRPGVPAARGRWKNPSSAMPGHTADGAPPHWFWQVQV